MNDSLDTEYLEQITDEVERSILSTLFEMFRTQIQDYTPELNVLNLQQAEFKSTDIRRHINRALADLNRGSPPSAYTIITFPADQHGLLVDGAVVYSLIGLGLLQLRNQYNTMDSGLSINMFQKSGQYQQWASMLLNMYLSDKAEFKRGQLARSYNAGFVGVGSEFGYRS